MPNDRARSSLLQNIDPKKYPKLSQFLKIQSLSGDEETKLLSNQQALNLLEEAIGEVENQRLSSVLESTQISRQKELDQQGKIPTSELQAESADLSKVRVDVAGVKSEVVEVEKSNDQQFSEQAPSQSPEKTSPSEVVKASESAELAELGQELLEIKEVDKEQEDNEATKKQQTVIDQLANQVQSPTQQVKPVVVLPITEQQQKLAKKKSIHFSIRWLAEWVEKIKKIFTGAVIYKEEVENSADV